MTYNYLDDSGESSQTSVLSDDPVAEDAPTVAWVDQTIDEAQRGGYLDQLQGEVEATQVISPNEYQTLLLDAQTAAGGEPAADPLAAPMTTTAAIRETIFARLRRPDGAPFAAGYTTGPAARKDHYEGEDVRAGAWRNKRNPDETNIVTEYEDRGTLDERAGQADDEGRLLDADGQLVADGSWGWVIDEETRALLLFNPSSAMWTAPDGSTTRGQGQNLLQLLRAGYRVQATHHTTPVAGMPVVGAGMMQVSGGYIVELTDESGHYQPDAGKQYAALQSLVDQGFSVEDARVRLTGNAMAGRPTGKQEWIDEAVSANPGFPTGDVSLRSEQFLQTEGDEYQIRYKAALNQHISGLGERPGTTVHEGPEPATNYGFYPDSDSDNESGSSSESDSSSESESDSSSESPSDVFVDEDGLRWRSVQDPSRPAGYLMNVPADDESSSSSAGQSDDESSQHPVDDSAEGDSSAEESSEDAGADFVQQARDYLAGAGRAAFAAWLRTLAPENQDQLLADPQLAAAWRGENAPPAPPAWQPADADLAAAATVNAAAVDDLDDRATGPYALAGFALLIGNDHDAQLAQYAATAADRVTGTFTVRKAGVGRGAGSLTFTGVPPAKQDIVRNSVRRFSRKEVRFA